MWETSQMFYSRYDKWIHTPAFCTPIYAIISHKTCLVTADWKTLVRSKHSIQLVLIIPFCSLMTDTEGDFIIIDIGFTDLLNIAEKKPWSDSSFWIILINFPRLSYCIFRHSWLKSNQTYLSEVFWSEWINFL